MVYMKLGSMMKMLGHGHVDVLKIDIEGYEWAVLEGLFSGGLLTEGVEAARTAGRQACPAVGVLLAECGPGARTRWRQGGRGAHRTFAVPHAVPPARPPRG